MIDFGYLDVIYSVIWVNFEKTLILLGFEMFLVGFWDVFGVVKMAEMLDFSGFVRSGYRSDFDSNLVVDVWIEQIGAFDENERLF